MWFVGIVYCLTQKDCQEVSQQLREQGVKARCYHAGLESGQRTKAHRLWMNDEINVIIRIII